MKNQPQLQPGSNRLASTASCSVEVIRTVQDLDRLDNEWDALVLTSNSSVYQTFSWQRTWWKHHGMNHELRCLVFRLGCELIGIAPIYLTRESILGMTIARHIRFIGNGLSDYLDIIVRPGHETVVCKEFARYLTATRAEWDIVDIEDANEDSTFSRFVAASLREYEILVYSFQGNVCPFVELPASWDSMISNLGPNTRYNIKRKSRKLDDQYDFEIEAYRNEEGNLVRGMEGFFQVHGARWNSLGFPSAFDDPGHRMFHHEIAQQFAQRGWLTLLFLKVDGLRVAAFLGFSFKSRLYMYQCNAFGPTEIMKQSPGLLLRSIAIKRGIAEGMKVFDFLRGDEMYKYLEWKSSTSRNWMFRCTHDSLGARVRLLLFILVEFQKKAVNRIRREFYSFRRFQSGGHPSVFQQTRYVLNRGIAILHIGRHYLSRHHRRSQSPERTPSVPLNRNNPPTNVH